MRIFREYKTHVIAHKRKNHLSVRERERKRRERERERETRVKSGAPYLEGEGRREMSEEEDERDQLASSSGGGGGGGEREEEEEEEEDVGEQRKGLTHLTWNYVLDTLEKCKQEREKHQDQRASSSQAFNVLAKRKRRTEAKRVRIGIVIEVKEGAEVVTTKRLPLHNVTPKGNDSQNGSRKRNRSASTTKKKIWDVTLGSFTSCCINSVLVEEQNKEDFIAPGAVVRYATTKASTSAASSPPTKVEGCDFRLLDVLHCQSKCQQENGSTLPSRSHLLRVWSQRHFQSTMSRSIENMSRFELALLKARIVSVVRVEIRAGSEFGDGKGKSDRSFGSRREFIEQSLRRMGREEEDDYASSSRDFDLSLFLRLMTARG